MGTIFPLLGIFFPNSGKVFPIFFHPMEKVFTKDYLVFLVFASIYFVIILCVIKSQNVV